MRKKWENQKRWENKEGVLIQVGLEKDSSLSPTSAFETQLCHVQLKPTPRSSSSRLDFYGARAEPCRNSSSQTPARRHAAGELIYFFVSLAGSRRPRSSSSCTCAERGGDVRSVLDQNGSSDGSWEDGDLNHEAVPLHHPHFLALPA